MRRVLVDTNVVLSAILFPGSIPAQVFAHVLAHERLILTQWIITELQEVTARKRPDLVPVMDELLSGIDYELAEPGGSRALMTMRTVALPPHRRPDRRGCRGYVR